MCVVGGIPVAEVVEGRLLIFRTSKIFTINTAHLNEWQLLKTDLICIDRQEQKYIYMYVYNSFDFTLLS